MVDISPSVAWLLIVAPSGAKTSLPIIYQDAPDIEIFLPSGLIDSTISQNSLIITYLLNITLQHNILAMRTFYLLIYQYQ